MLENKKINWALCAWISSIIYMWWLLICMCPNNVIMWKLFQLYSLFIETVKVFIVLNSIYWNGSDTYFSSLQGIWGGMLGGICLQTIILVVITSLTNWNTEVTIFLSCSKLCFRRLDCWFQLRYELISQAEQAESRVKRWGGSTRNNHWLKERIKI